eukprot:TRINITY_DN7883_c0_g1_i1.p1 TRINITY_DN7883_c0_g1~~TRINITY_DN7883_c0_g1_i1.p1  ORF type:complete len:634 (+),score=118.78 TRINITY_DN7883_c0_g1_i1:172-1902(+)
MDDSLFGAIQRGDIESVKKFISEDEDKKIDINEYHETGMTPLHFAVLYNYFDIVKILLDSYETTQIDVNLGTTEYGHTALHLAFCWMLTECNSNNSIKPGDVVTDAECKECAEKIFDENASEGTNLEIIEALLNDPRININALSTARNESVLMLGCLGSREHAVEVLLEKKGLHMIDKNTDGNNVLHACALSGSAPIVRALLEALYKGSTSPFLTLGASAEPSSASETEAGEHKYGDTLTVPGLTTSVATPDSRESDVQASSSLSALKSMTVSESPRKRSSTFSKRRSQKRSSSAIFTGNFDLLKLINAKNEKGETPLSIAVSWDHFDVVIFLLKAGADVSILMSDGSSIIANTTSPVMQGVLSNWKHWRKFQHQVIGLEEGLFKTSDTDPLQIDFLDSGVMAITPGRLGMCMCPGRNKKSWRRDLNKDLIKFYENEVDTVVSLVRDAELTFMGIPQLFQRYTEEGMESIHRPIQDKWIPSHMRILVDLVKDIIARLKQGKSIVAHCNGGKGRAGMVVTATLVALGIPIKESIKIVRSARPGTIRNPAQIAYIRLFRMSWFSHHQPKNQIEGAHQK